MLPIKEAPSNPDSRYIHQPNPELDECEGKIQSLFRQASIPIDSNKESKQVAIGVLVKPSLRAIQDQSQLFRNARLSKEWARNHNNLSITSNGLHYVFPLREESGSCKTLSYFKVGEYERYLEVMIWDIAVLLGWEDLFTPTKLDELYVNLILVADGKKNYSVKCKEELIGSIQTALEGVVYDKRDKNIRIDQRSLCKAFIAMYLLGLNDVHGNNLIVQNDGALRLFDNTKCLPPSNTWVFTMNEMFPIHRFIPFELDLCHQPLGEDILKEMAEIVSNVRKNLQSIEKYFQSAWIAKIEKLLPKHWFHREECMTALIQRLDKLEAALERRVQRSLFNIFEEVYPSYRFVYLLTLLYEMDKKKGFQKTKEEYSRTVHGYVGGVGLLRMIATLSKQRYDLALIQERANDLSMDLNDLVSWVIERPEEAKIHPRTERQSVDEFIKFYFWLRQFRRVPYDYKDTNMNDPPFLRRGEAISKVYNQFLIHHGFGPFQEGNRSSLELQTARLHTRPYLFKCLDERRWYAVYTGGSYEDLSERMEAKEPDLDRI